MRDIEGRKGILEIITIIMIMIIIIIIAMMIIIMITILLPLSPSLSTPVPLPPSSQPPFTRLSTEHQTRYFGSELQAVSNRNTLLSFAGDTFLHPKKKEKIKMLV